MWSGVKPNVEHFRVFGCVCHVHVPAVKRTKLDEKSHKCVLLGLSNESKGYRLYDPVTKKIIVSRDVKFEENEHWDWEASHKDDVMIDLEWGETHVESDDEEQGTDKITAESVRATESNTGASNDINNDSESSATAQVPDVHDSGNDKRERHPPVWMNDFVTGEELDSEEFLNMALEHSDPETFEEAIQEEKWRIAMNAEMESIEKNDTWELTDLPSGVKKIGVKWIYKTKLKENGEVDKFKARLVARGYSQRYGVDYNEVFAPVSRMDTVRMIIALAANKGWQVYQLDVKSAFLYGTLTEEVYVEQPKGYIKKGNEQKVYKLHKALYGLKQAPRAWFSKIEGYFLAEGFQKSSNEQTLFLKCGDDDSVLIVSIYVDDLIYTSNSEELLIKFKKSMKETFDMNDLGKMRFFLGIEVVQFDKGIFIHQRKYALEILQKFNMENCNAVKNPMVPGQQLTRDEGGELADETEYKRLVGSLIYITATRPDVVFSVSLLSRYMSKPTQNHMAAAKRVLRYLQGTHDYGIMYMKGGKDCMNAYTDSDYAGDLMDRKSTSGYLFLLSSGAVAWASKKQPIVTLSSTEAEFVAATACACQAVWMRKVLSEMRHVQKGAIIIHCDNNSTIKLSKNPIMHGRTKHIDVRYYFLRDLVKEGSIEMIHCGSKEQLADIMTKPLCLAAFVKLKTDIGVCDLPAVN